MKKSQLIARSIVWLINCGLVILLASCSLVGISSKNKRLDLAEFTESDVHVEIKMERTGDGQALLLAIFTPKEEDAHLYSKDLPKEGVAGLGRPTLIELPEGSYLKAAGELQASVEARLEPATGDLPALPVYPAGPVTLTLPVYLPQSIGSPIADQLLVTFMTCSDDGCRAPVVEKIVDIQLPKD